MRPEQIVGLLAEPERRQVVAALILGATTLDDIARTSGLESREATEALVRLVQGGLVESDGTSPQLRASWSHVGHKLRAIL